MEENLVLKIQSKLLYKILNSMEIKPLNPNNILTTF